MAEAAVTVHKVVAARVAEQQEAGAVRATEAVGRAELEILLGVVAAMHPLEAEKNESDIGLNRSVLQRGSHLQLESFPPEAVPQVFILR